VAIVARRLKKVLWEVFIDLSPACVKNTPIFGDKDKK